jgi:hypothetical protein
MSDCRIAESSADGSASSLVRRSKPPAGLAFGDEREPRREHHRAHHPRHDHTPVLERLAQALDRVAAELRELVEEQHPMVRQCS